ncbi:unnamed protein product, partial [Rotaria sp. Silwood1]
MSDSENELDFVIDSENASDSEEQFDDENNEASSALSTDISLDLQDPTFSKMRIFNTIRPELKSSYFEIEISGRKKFIHKQTACWLLAENKASLSSDRLTR